MEQDIDNRSTTTALGVVCDCETAPDTTISSEVHSLLGNSSCSADYPHAIKIVFDTDISKQNVTAEELMLVENHLGETLLIILRGTGANKYK